MNKLATCTVILAAVLAVPARAQAPFVPFIAFEAQRRAQSGFPLIDESALDAAAGVQSGAYDATRSRYVWRLERDPGPATFQAEFIDHEGEVIASSPVVITDHTAEAEVPAESRLLGVDRMVIRRLAPP